MTLIRGQIRHGRPEVPLTVLDANGNPVSGFACIDTGFNEELTLMRADIERLGLISAGTSLMTTASGQTLEFPAYRATIIWHDRPKLVRVLQSEVDPLIGTALLWDSRLSIDFAVGGEVVISEI